MYITWYGLSCLKIEGKNNLGEFTIVTDPFDPKKTGLKLPRVTRADITLQSRADREMQDMISPAKADSSVFFIPSPGEYEKSGVFVAGTHINHEQHIAYAIEAENLHLYYCGPLHRLPSEQELENLENVDVLLVPVGGHGVLDGKIAAELVSELEPRVIIPIHYKLPGLKTQLDGPEVFLKAIGVKPGEILTKVKITKKDLPQEETQVFLLTPP